MKEYRHVDIPELTARIDHEWHKEYRSNNFTLMHNMRVIATLEDKEIEGNPFWELIWDTEQGGEVNPPQAQGVRKVANKNRE